MIKDTKFRNFLIGVKDIFGTFSYRTITIDKNEEVLILDFGVNSIVIELKKDVVFPQHFRTVAEMAEVLEEANIKIIDVGRSGPLIELIDVIEALKVFKENPSLKWFYFISTPAFTGKFVKTKSLKDCKKELIRFFGKKSEAGIEREIGFLRGLDTFELYNVVNHFRKYV